MSICNVKYGIMVGNMATLADYRNERLKKLETLKAQGFNPYPAEVERTIGAGEVAPQFDQLEGSTQTVAGPVWLINTPKFISPLAKANPDGVSTQRFQPVIAGSELGNGYSELNNPIDQLRRFEEQQKLREAGDDEAMMLDIDFVEMLEYGMPPACGWGYSERVFWMLEGVTAREGVPFPTMRYEVDPVTRKIYPELKL